MDFNFVKENIVFPNSLYSTWLYPSASHMRGIFRACGTELSSKKEEFSKAKSCILSLPPHSNTHTAPVVVVDAVFLCHRWPVFEWWGLLVFLQDGLGKSCLLQAAGLRAAVATFGSLSCLCEAKPHTIRQVGHTYAQTHTCADQKQQRLSSYAAQRQKKNRYHAISAY